ncbi:MAG: hypothetical protein QW196_08215 [Sulfolobales archaeon]
MAILKPSTSKKASSPMKGYLRIVSQEFTEEKDITTIVAKDKLNSPLAYKETSLSMHYFISIFTLLNRTSE